MYLPAHFEECSIEAIRDLIAERPLATLVTLDADGGIVADHIPLLLEERGEHGTLVGHVARNNALWHAHPADREALVIFQGPDAYITPNWYETKRETHKVVPTYNYAVVHAYGPLIVHEDEKWLRGAVGKLTKAMERAEPEPWRMGDAPADFLREQLGNIVGIEMPITRLIAKWKTSQNRPVADRAGVVTGLTARDRDGDAEMATLVRERMG